MVAKIISILLLLTCIQDFRTASYSLTISPAYVRINEATTKVSIHCHAGVALAQCQFSWWDDHGGAGPLLDLSEGKEAIAHSAHLSDVMMGYSYNGQGLQYGHCGVTLEVKGDKRWIVGCRTRATAGGGWKYAWNELHARNKSLVHATDTPRQVILLPGNPALIQVKANESLSRCNFFVPGVARKIGFKAGEDGSSDKERGYRGEGLKEGDCGLALDDVQAVNNGPALFWMSNTNGDGDYSRFVALVVASPPIAPVMRVVRDNTSVTATCVVQGGRPTAKISWLLDDVIIRLDSEDDSPADPQDAWRWPWMQGSTSQRLSFTLKPDHDGLMLRCRVSHVALKEPLEVSERVGSTVPTAAESTSNAVEVGPCQECPKECPSSNELLREARARASLSELAEEAAKRSLEAAKSRAKATEARVKELEVKEITARLSVETAQLNVRREEAMAKDAEEELEFQRERRRQGHRRPHTRGSRKWQSYTPTRTTTVTEDGSAVPVPT